MPIAYLTDVEGEWEKVATFCDQNPLLRLSGDALELAEGTTFVFGGDAVDRGPHAMRVVRCLTEAKERYGERVVLLAGNRDLNKLRLRRELAGFPHPRAPAEVCGDRVLLLQWTLTHTMGAGAAFAHRRAELGAVTDAEVVDSYLAELENDGALTRYLRLCRLAWRWENTLFVHGGVGEDSLCTVPTLDGSRPLPDVDSWIAALDEWYVEQLDAYSSSAVESAGPPSWQPIIDYQQPAPGRRGNPRSVVYSCLSDDNNDPYLPAPPVVARLKQNGIDRLVVGHTPSGDTPSILRDPERAFELVMADNNYGRVRSAPHVRVDREAISIGGEAVLDDGRRLNVAFTLALHEPSPIGRRVDDGPLLKAPLDDGTHLAMHYRVRYQLEQTAVTLQGERLTVPYER